MDVNRLSTGEKVAGISGLALLIIMFLFSWFSLEDIPEGGLNAWESFSLIDLALLLAVIAGIALAVTAASQSRVDLPVTLSAITAGLGILAVVLIVFRIISPPDFEALGIEVELERSIGVFLGLLAAAGVAVGGWLAMQEEGTSFGDQADRLGDRGPGTGAGPGAGTGAPPPPPPPPAGGTGGPPSGTGGPAA
jgi:hypothetical protein